MLNLSLSLSKFNYKQLLAALFLGMVACFLIVSIAEMQIDHHDWLVFYEAITNAADPYSTFGYFNPPWLVWLMLPLGIFSFNYAYAIWIVISIGLCFYSVRILKGSLLAAVLILLSPAFLRQFVQGNVDMLILLGFALMTVQSPVSYLLLLIKPQIAFLSLITDWKKNKNIQPVLVVIGAMLISILLYGTWFLMLDDKLNTRSNISIFPYGIPIGMILFFIGYKTENLELSAISSAFFTPYLPFHSLLFYWALICVKLDKWAIPLLVIFWAVTLILLS